MTRALLTAAGIVGAPFLAANADSYVQNSEERARIEQAVPDRAPATPARPRRLLIFALNVGYGGHPSIAHANEAFTLMGRKTGAFETTVTNDPAVFERESLKRFDAVFFNNTVGNCFTNADRRRNLLEFVTGGAGFIGVHGTSVAFTHWPGAVEDWPEFGYLLGARGANHKESDERVRIKVEDPRHPLTALFGGGFEYRDEFFRFSDPYSRTRVRVLLSIDNTGTDLTAGESRGNPMRADNDYALAWVRNYGRGRVFYCTIAHNPRVFWDPKMLRFYLGAAQFALGDLAVPTTPSARLSPAIRAQERLGLRLGIEAYTFHKFAFFEAIEKTAQLGLPWVGGLSFQKVSREIPKNFDPQLSDAELQEVRLKLEAAGLRLLTYYLQDIPGDEAGCRKVFEFGRKMGIETFISEPRLEALDSIEKFCDEYGINVALHNHDQKASPNYWNPEGVLEACKRRSRRIGACPDVGYWMRAGIDPVQGLRTLGDRVLTIQMHDLHSLTADGHDVPWGTGAGRPKEILAELARLRIRPTMIGLEYSYDWMESMPKIAQTIEFFNATVLALSPEEF
jgi:type 1 glutamine amidotransferase/sugar phosphate isomerase/epimerase